jgi:hypothetical protein
LACLASPLLAQTPAKFSLRTLSAQMKFDLAELRVQPGAKVRLTFENPDVCTFPGHAASIRGVLKVLGEGNKLKDLKFAVDHEAQTKLPDFKSLTPHRKDAVSDNRTALNFDAYENQYGVVLTRSSNAVLPSIRT